jgi:hypothetical protein
MCCWDGSMVCDATDCKNEPGSDPFSFNQSSNQAFYYVFTAFDNLGDNLEAGDWIGAFNTDTTWNYDGTFIASAGDVCVGAVPWTAGNPQTIITVMGNDGYEYSAGYLQAGDIPSYKIFDASDGVYYDVSPSSNQGFGNLSIVFIERMDALVLQNLGLHEGANLVSFYTCISRKRIERYQIRTLMKSKILQYKSVHAFNEHNTQITKPLITRW